MKAPSKCQKKEQGKKESKDLGGQVWEKEHFIFNKIQCEIIFHR